MISKTMQDAINAQIRAEMYSSNLYLAMAANAEAMNLKGLAHWMRLQSQEELGHAIKLFDYLVDRGGRAVIGAIDEPPQAWPSPRAMFEQALSHERNVTALIHGLYETALEEKDYATQNMLQWFISEQVEEEAAASQYAEKLKMIGDSSNAIFMVDKELGKRGRE